MSDDKEDVLCSRCGNKVKEPRAEIGRAFQKDNHPFHCSKCALELERERKVKRCPKCGYQFTNEELGKMLQK